MTSMFVQDIKEAESISESLLLARPCDKNISKTDNNIIKEAPNISMITT